jgi:hypothetical protein
VRISPIIVAIIRDVITVFTVITVAEEIKSKFCKIIKSVSLTGRRTMERFLMESVVLKILLKGAILKKKEQNLGVSKS